KRVQQAERELKVQLTEAKEAEAEAKKAARRATTEAEELRGLRAADATQVERLQNKLEQQAGRHADDKKQHAAIVEAFEARLREVQATDAEGRRSAKKAATELEALKAARTDEARERTKLEARLEELKGRIAEERSQRETLLKELDVKLK